MLVRKRILQACAEKGLSMNQVRKSGIPSFPAYSSKTRKSCPSAKRLREICLALDCSADWLLGLSDEKSLSGAVGEMPDQEATLRAAARSCDKYESRQRVRLRKAAQNVRRRGCSPSARTYVLAAQQLGCSVDKLLGLEE